MVRITRGRFKTAFTAAERPLTKSVYNAPQAPIYKGQMQQEGTTRCTQKGVLIFETVAFIVN